MLTQIQALIALLDDDSPTVLATVTDRLMELGDQSLEALRQASDSPSPHVRMRARGLVTRLLQPSRLENLVERVESTTKNDHSHLESVCLGLARIHTPDLDESSVTRHLDKLAETIRPELDGSKSERDRLEAFLEGIHGTLCFRVSSNDWTLGDHFLHTVIERRRGLPLNLAIVYALLGHRLNLTIRIIGSPMRAMALARVEDDWLYLNPQENWRILTRSDAEQFLVRQGLVGVNYDRFLPVLSVTRTLQRNVRNLVNYCDDARDTELKALFQDLIGALSRLRMTTESVATQDAAE